MSDKSFPVQKFNDALMETKMVKSKLAPFISQFQNYNMQWIYEAFNQLFIYLHKPNIRLNYKFNALNAIRVLFDTSDFLLVNWIEIFFLPKIKSIALKCVNQPVKERGKNYFINLGYRKQDEPEIQKYGYNYAILSLQLLQVASKVKPFRLFEIQQTQQPSEYYQAFQFIKNNGYQVPKQLFIYKKPQQIQNKRQKYHNNKKKLAQEQSSQFFQNYENFCLLKLDIFLNQKQHENEDQNFSIMKVYESGDLIVSSDAIEKCKAVLSTPNDLIRLKNAISFFDQLMISADYEAFFILFYDETLLAIFDRILNIDNCQDYSLKRGKRFLSELNNPGLSEQVYVYFLQCFKKWSQLSASFLSYQKKTDDHNIMKSLIQCLSNKLEMQFPQVKNFQNELKTLKENMNKNKQRNLILVQDIQEKDSELKRVILKVEQVANMKSKQAKSSKNIPSQKTIKSTQQKQMNKNESYKSQKNQEKVQQLGYKQENLDTPVKQIMLSENNLGYDIKQKSQKNIYNHLGYQNQVESKQENKINNIQANQVNQVESRLIEGEEKLRESKGIKKTQNLQNSKKSIKQSSKNINLNQQFQQNNSEVKSYHPSLKQIKQNQSIQKNLRLQDIALDEEFEQNLSVNKPKQFKSLGRYKLETQKKVESLQNVNVRQPNQSRVDFDKSEASLKNSIVQEFSPHQKLSNSNFIKNTSQSNLGYSQHNYQFNQQKQEQQLQQLLQDDEINAPLCSPLEESFHDIEQLENKLRANNVPSFKKCFQADRYILPQDKSTKIYWLQDATKNLIKPGVSNFKKSKSRLRSNINVPEILEESNKKYQNQLKVIEQEKNRKIKELEVKIRNLENQTVSMKDQINSQKQQLKTLKSNSEFDKESVGQKGYLMDMQNIAAQKISSPAKLGYGNLRQFQNSFYKQNLYLDPTGRLISSKLYKSFFQQFRKEKQKKGLLKNKDLLHKDKEIQIGCMVRKQGDKLIVTFYVTPQNDICALGWKIDKNYQMLRIESEPRDSIGYVRGKKQEKIYVTVEIGKVPYYLPEVEFCFEHADERGVTMRVKLLIPCAFHKFVTIKDLSEKFDDYFNNNQHVIRGEQVPYSKKILKNFQILRDYFPTISLLNKGNPNDKGQLSYGGLACYDNFQFPVKISIKPNQFLYIQGSVYSVDESRLDIVEFYISLLTHLLMKDVE